MRLISNLLLLLTVILSLILRVNQLHAQTLPMPNVIAAPCYGSIGMTAPVEVDPVPGADGYLWDAQPTTGILVNGLASPVTTVLPNADLTFTSSSPVWKVCVSAFSTCCTSPWNCFFIYNSVPIAFLPSNYTSLPPGITTDFGIYYLCLPLLGQHTIHWYVTGNITFSNGLQSITTGQDTTVVPLTFGGNFNGGTLCVYTINSLGLSSDTVCTNIGVLTSVTENGINGTEIYHQQETNEIVIRFPEDLMSGFKFRLNDINGRSVFYASVDGQVKVTSIKLGSDISPGIYIAEIFYNDAAVRKKIPIGR